MTFYSQVTMEPEEDRGVQVLRSGPVLHPRVTGKRRIFSPEQKIELARWCFERRKINGEFTERCCDVGGRNSKAEPHFGRQVATFPSTRGISAASCTAFERRKSKKMLFLAPD